MYIQEYDTIMKRNIVPGHIIFYTKVKGNGIYIINSTASMLENYIKYFQL